MKEIVVNIDLVSYCGLYCGACRSYLKDKCSGCAKNEKATWCKTRECCKQNNFNSCADCNEAVFSCKKANNPIANLIGLIFNTDRKKAVEFMKKYNRQKFAEKMTERRRMCFKRSDII